MANEEPKLGAGTRPAGTGPDSIQATAPSEGVPRILGMSTADLAGNTVEELHRNKTAITMVMHYYKQLLDENTSLKNDLNTLRTYVSAYERKRTYAGVGAVLLMISNVGIGFGVNLLTNEVVWPGLATLLPALASAAVGLWLSLKEGQIK